MKKPSRKKSAPSAPNVHQKPSGIDITIDQFGALKGNVSIDQVNRFLDEHVADKKVPGRKKRK